MNVRLSVFTVLVFCITACFKAQAVNDLDEFVATSRAQFVGILQNKYDSFELWEAFSKFDNKQENFFLIVLEF